MRCYFLSTSQHHRVQTHHHKTVCILYYQGCKGSVRQIQICCPSSSENVSNIRRFGYICMLFCRFSEVLGDFCFLGHLDEDTFKGLSSHPEYTDSWQLYLVFYGPVQQYLRRQHFGEKSVESPKSVGFFCSCSYSKFTAALFMLRINLDMSTVTGMGSSADLQDATTGLLLHGQQVETLLPSMQPEPVHRNSLTVLLCHLWTRHSSHSLLSLFSVYSETVL